MNPADGVVESSTRPWVAAVGGERRRVQVALRSQSQRTLCLMEDVGERRVRDRPGFCPWHLRQSRFITKCEAGRRASLERLEEFVFRYVEFKSK